MKKILLLFLLLFTLGFLASCGDNPDTPVDPNPPHEDDPIVVVDYEIIVSDSYIILNEGESIQVNASVTPETTLTWSSSDSSVATCNNGLIKAIKSGNATITVSTSDGKAKKEIKVKVNEVVEENKVEELSRALYEVLQNYNNSDEFNVLIEIKSDSSNSKLEMIYKKNSNGLYDEFFYHIQGNVELMVYIKDGVSYMKEETNMQKTTLTDAEAKTIINDYNGKKFLEKVSSFYDEVSFFDSLIELSENQFKLNLEKYNGKALNVGGISEVLVNVSYNNNELNTIELVYSNGNSVKVTYNGYNNVNVPVPNDLNKYTE